MSQWMIAIPILLWVMIKLSLASKFTEPTLLLFRFITSIFWFFFQLEEQLISQEFTDYKITAAQTSQWNVNSIYTTCINYDFVDYSSRHFLGMFGGGDITSKTFSNLPPHWSLSVRMDILIFSSFDPSDGDYIEV